MRLSERERESEGRMTRTTYDTSCILYQSSIPTHADVTYVQCGVYTLLHAHIIKGDTNCRRCVKIFAIQMFNRLRDTWLSVGAEINNASGSETTDFASLAVIMNPSF